MASVDKYNNNPLTAISTVLQETNNKKNNVTRFTNELLLFLEKKFSLYKEGERELTKSS